MDEIQKPPNVSTNKTPARNFREKQQLAMVLLSSKEQRCHSQTGLSKPALREFNTSKDFKTKFARQETMTNFRISSIRGGQTVKPHVGCEDREAGSGSKRAQSAKGTRGLNNCEGDSESPGAHSLVTYSTKSVMSRAAQTPARGTRPTYTGNHRPSSKACAKTLEPTGIYKTNKVAPTTRPIQIRISQRTSPIQHCSRIDNIDTQGFTSSPARLKTSSSIKTSVCQDMFKQHTVSSNRLVSTGVGGLENAIRPLAKRESAGIVQKISSIIRTPLITGEKDKTKDAIVVQMSPQQINTCGEEFVVYEVHETDEHYTEHDQIGTTSTDSNGTDQCQNQGDGSENISPRCNKILTCFVDSIEMKQTYVHHATSMENNFGDYEILENEILNNPKTDIHPSGSFTLSVEAVSTRDLEQICNCDSVVVNEPKANKSFIELEAYSEQKFNNVQKSRSRTLDGSFQADGYQIFSRTSEASRNFNYKPISKPAVTNCSYSDTSLPKSQDTSSVHSAGTLSIITSSQSDMALTSDNVPTSAKLASWKSQQRLACGKDKPVIAIIETMLPFLNWSTAIILPEIGLRAKDSLTAINLPQHCACNEVITNEIPSPSECEHSPRVRTTLCQFGDSGETESAVAPLKSDNDDDEIMRKTCSEDSPYERVPEEITLQETVEYLGDDCFEYSPEPTTPQSENVIIQLSCNQVWSDDSDDDRVDFEISNCTDTFDYGSKIDTFACSSKSDLLCENSSVMPCEEACSGNVCTLPGENISTYHMALECNRNDTGGILPYDGITIPTEEMPLCESNSSECDSPIPCLPNNLHSSPIPAYNKKIGTTFGSKISTRADILKMPTAADEARTPVARSALSVHSQSTSTGDYECRARKSVLQKHPFKPFQFAPRETKCNKSPSLNGNKKMFYPRFTASCPGDSNERSALNNRKFNQFNGLMVDQDVVNEKSQLAKNSSISFVKPAGHELCENTETSSIHLGNAMMKSVGVSCKIYAPTVSRGRSGDHAGDRGKENFASTKCGNARAKTMPLENRPRWR